MHFGEKRKVNVYNPNRRQSSIRSYEGGGEVGGREGGSLIQTRAS